MSGQQIWTLKDDRGRSGNTLDKYFNLTFIGEHCVDSKGALGAQFQAWSLRDLAVGPCISKVLNAAVAGLGCALWILDAPISEKLLTTTPVVGDLTQD